MKELMGEWASIRDITADVERRVADNLATPCIRNARSLLVEAVAHAYEGSRNEAQRWRKTRWKLPSRGSASGSSARACGLR